MKNRFLNNYHFWIIAAASFLIVLPLILFGFPSGNVDLIHHIQLAANNFHSIKSGIFVPNWVAEENFGYGSVVVRFYPPLTQFFLAVLNLIFGNWQTAFIVSFFFWSFVGGFGVYLLTDSFFKNKWQATIAAVLFIFAHYHVNQLYNAFMFSEFTALSILPFAVFYAKRTCEEKNPLYVLKFGISVALIILSNLPMMVISAICVGLFVLFFLKGGDFLHQAARLLSGCLIALALSSFYWLRIIFELQWLNIYQPNTDPHYDFRNNFLLDSFELDERGTWFVSAMFVALIVLVLVSLVVSGKIKSLFESRFLTAFFVIFIICSFLMLSVSTPIWENISVLQRLQFPRRFLAITSLCAAVLTAFAFGFIRKENWNAKRPVILILIGISFIYCFFSIRQVAMGSRFIPGEQFSALFETSRSSAVLEHWQTGWMKPENLEQKNQFTAENRNHKIVVWSNEYRKIEVSEGEKTRAEIGTFYYPHWQAFVNGSRVPINKSSDGLMVIDLPSEPSRVEFLFVEPQMSLFSRKFSLAAWIICFFAIIYGTIRQLRADLRWVDGKRQKRDREGACQS
jgi:hypothetical protein